jgi:hypothetical protein
VFEGVEPAAPGARAGARAVRRRGRLGPSVGAVWSTALLVDHLGRADSATRMADLGGTADVGQVAEALIHRIRRHFDV